MLQLLFLGSMVWFVGDEKRECVVVATGVSGEVAAAAATTTSMISYGTSFRLNRCLVLALSKYMWFLFCFFMTRDPPEITHPTCKLWNGLVS
jgi:hypothetical protein